MPLLPGPTPGWAREHLRGFQPSWGALVSGRLHEPQSRAAMCWPCSRAASCRTQFPLCTGEVPATTGCKDATRCPRGARCAASHRRRGREGQLAPRANPSLFLSSCAISFYFCFPCWLTLSCLPAFSGRPRSAFHHGPQLGCLPRLFVPVPPAIHPSLHPPARQSTRPSICPSACLPIYPSAHFLASFILWFIGCFLHVHIRLPEVKQIQPVPSLSVQSNRGIKI